MGASRQGVCRQSERRVGRVYHFMFIAFCTGPKSLNEQQLIIGCLTCNQLGVLNDLINEILQTWCIFDDDSI